MQSRLQASHLAGLGPTSNWSASHYSLILREFQACRNRILKPVLTIRVFVLTGILPAQLSGIT
jgi:hypothetical protein